MILLNLQPLIDLCRQARVMKEKKNSSSCMVMNAEGLMVFDHHRNAMRMQTLATFDLFMIETLVAFGKRSSFATIIKTDNGYSVTMNALCDSMLPQSLGMVECETKSESRQSQLYLAACNGAIKWSMQMVEGPLEAFFAIIIRSDWLDNNKFLSEMESFSMDVSKKMEIFRHIEIATFGDYMVKLSQWLLSKNVSNENILLIHSALFLNLGKRIDFGMRSADDAKRTELLNRLSLRSVVDQSKDLAIECRWKFNAMVECLMRKLLPYQGLIESLSQVAVTIE